MARNYNDQPLLGERLKKLLKDRGITQKKLADDLKINKDHLNYCIRNNETNENMLVKIGEYLDCNPLYLTNESFFYMPFGTYESFTYDYNQCVRGLLYMMEYKPSDFSKDEFDELKALLGRFIDRYASEHSKLPYTVFWSGAGDSSVEVTFTKNSNTQNSNKQNKKGE